MQPSDSASNLEIRGYDSFAKSTDLARIRQTAKEQGVMQAIRLVASKIPSRIYWRLYYSYHLPIDRRFDRKHGVDTCGVHELSELTIDSSNIASGLEYEPTPVKAFPSMLKSLPKELGKFVFVDFGCGKGRTLLLASHFKFKRVIGVEFAKELHEAATKNLANYKDSRQKCNDITAIHSDAAKFSIPDDACVFYFYYPFGEDVMRKVLDNIVTSYRANPRPMYFINRLDRTSWVEVCERIYGEIDLLRVRDRRRSLFTNPNFEPVDVVTYETIDPGDNA
jgi:SAM-dependent methyltransferase